MKKIILFLVLSCILAPAAYSKQGHLILLAVKETDGGFEGSTADLYLEIRPGNGRVFLDTFPLTKVDTQISTRFAKEMACSFLNKDCSRYDFIYTIKADSAIIAGPSAGAAAAVLTVALLDGLKVNESVSITGTINSGGLIGYVGGIKEKIDAAKDTGLKKVIIPKGEKIVSSETESYKKMEWDVINDTLKILITNNTKRKETETDIGAYSKQKEIEIREATTLNDAIFEFTGKKYQEEGGELTIDPSYNEIMKKLAVDLCNRSDKLKKDVKKAKFGDKHASAVETAANLTKDGIAAFKEEKYYSSASYCFGANVKYSFLYMVSKNFSQENTLEGINIVKKSIRNMENSIANKEIRTITDLESYAAVKERLLEAEDYLELALGNINETDKALESLAYASERVYSAISWHEFFQHLGKKFDLNKNKVKKSCQEKISEAEERYQYVKLLFPTLLKGTKGEIDHAYSYLGNGEYELCLFKASMAKSQADIILNLIGLDDNRTKELLDTKLGIVKRSIIRNNNQNVFPVMAYSYYEYAGSLGESDIYSALLYSEYALEMGNFDMYFDSSQGGMSITVDSRIVIFVAGILVGLAPCLFFIKIIKRITKRNRKRAEKHKKKRRKR